MAVHGFHWTGRGWSICRSRVHVLLVYNRASCELKDWTKWPNRHLIGRRRLLHPLSLQLCDLGLQQVDHLLVVHLHPPRLLLSRLGQLDPGPQSPTLLRSEFYFLRKGGRGRRKDERKWGRRREVYLCSSTGGHMTQQSISRASAVCSGPAQSFLTLINLSWCWSHDSEFLASGRVRVMKLFASARGTFLWISRPCGRVPAGLVQACRLPAHFCLW